MEELLIFNSLYSSFSREIFEWVEEILWEKSMIYSYMWFEHEFMFMNDFDKNKRL